jgi:UDP-N-acetylmuramate dehydrogenase
MKIQENISLKPYNTFGLDKKAKFFVIIQSVSELVDSLKWANEQNLPILILGGGSNILLTQDQNLLVIKIELKGIQPQWETDEHIWIEAASGEIWHDLVLYGIMKNWGGLENLSLIPGTVGASPMQNIGAYGVEIKDVFQSLKALNRNNFEIEEFNSAQCLFGYRESIFKHELKDQYIILSVTFKLDKNPILKLEYGAIKEVLSKKQVINPTIKSVSDAVIEIRQSKLPDPKKIGNAGSFFKNPTISLAYFERLKSIYPNIPGFANEDGIKIPAAWLIDQCGWKGKRFGNVGVHAHQPLVLVNFGDGEGKDIQELSTQIQTSVLEKFEIKLNPEVNFL